MFYPYDYNREDKDTLIFLLAYKLERQATTRIFNKNRKRNTSARYTVEEAREKAREEIQWILNNVDTQIEVEKDTPLVEEIGRRRGTYLK